MIETTVKVDGMMCGMCEAHIGDAIRKQFPEDKKISASAGKGEAKFLLEAELPKPMLEHELHAAVDPLGYKILSVKTGEPEAKKGFFHFGKH